MDDDCSLKEFAKATLVALCIFWATVGAYFLASHAWPGLSEQPFAKWEGVFFGYPVIDGWHPPFLTLLLFKVLVPSLASLLLIRTVPPIVVSRSHASDYAAVLVLEAINLVLFHLLGQDETYGDWGKAATLAVPFVVFIWLMRRLPVPEKLGGHRLFGGWLIGVMLAAWTFVVVAKPGSIGTMFLYNLLWIGFAEEFCFRGVIQGYLLERCPGRVWWGISKANVVAALLFAWSHNPSLDPQQLSWLLFTFSMGLALGMVRERTGSWFAPALGHGANAFYWLYVMLDEGIR